MPTKSSLKTSAKKPTRGRPPAHKAGDRRALLLDAALTLFARQGIAATSLNAIATQAKVTPALVHYYFGNREQLVEVVLAERIVPVVDQLSNELTQYQAAPLQAIYALTQRMFTAMQEQPWLPPLWVREVLCEGGLLREHLLRDIAPGMAKKVSQLAGAAQQDGQLNAALEPRLLIVSLLGLTLFPLAAAPIWRQLPGYQSISNELLAQHMLALLAHGIEAPIVENDIGESGATRNNSARANVANKRAVKAAFVKATAVEKADQKSSPAKRRIAKKIGAANREEQTDAE